ncbi:Peroxidase [Handroanthus impetiginosus]|uniref:Peroxidase n=1 Tax=Handroanthus impetiginosus TaxID=429701 RepID=A0A2G9HTP8_9LAMI|nr:Peroxidase [Handroanthus impetiginosus]
MRWFLVMIAAVLLNFHLFSVVSASIVKHSPLKGVAKSPVLPPSAYLSTAYYQKSCPNLEAIIHEKVSAWVKRDPTLAPAIIRLHFHDCAVRGCDASILLNHRGSERAAEASRSLRGFTLIDEIKAEVEKQCPKTVSCADILTTAARDATVLAGGPFWEVPFGRKDGKISLAKEANIVPQGHENITSLINYFEKELGLTFVDLVVLSGSHTIGRSTCYSIKQRLYNFNGTRKPDPSMNVNYLNLLKKQCRLDTNYVNLDVTTPRTFDVAYYQNLGKKMGLLSTDQLLYSDVRTTGLVSLMASQPDFFMGQFAVSMVNLGNVNVLVGKNHGEIRLKCNYVNY